MGVLSYSVAHDPEAALLSHRVITQELANAPQVVEPQQPERPEQQVERPAERPAEERPEQQRPEVPEQLVGPAGAG